MKTFLTSNATTYRLARTIVQAVIGVLIANIDVIVGAFSIAPEWKTIIVALTVAVLSPIMAEVGKHTNNEEGEE